MKTLAIVFCYRRPTILGECLRTLVENTTELPDEILLIDDGSEPPMPETIRALVEQYRGRAVISYLIKGRNRGFSDSAVMALDYAKRVNPKYLFFIESDHIFRKHGLDTVVSVLDNTEHGQTCLGIAGYDHPYSYHGGVQANIFPQFMVMQMGADNCNRPALFKAFDATTKFGPIQLKLVSNTCFQSYLHWANIQKLNGEFPELMGYLERACKPVPVASYPPSETYARTGVVDDGMLSHGISFVWNKWALAHGIDRDKFGAWLNIMPSVAQNVNGGGMHGAEKEGDTCDGSPSWTGEGS